MTRTAFFANPLARLALTALASSALVLAVAFPSHAAELTDQQKDIVGLGTEIEDTIQLGSQDLRTTASSIINAALGLLGIIAVVVVVVGGFFWMTAGGNEEQIEKAKGWIFSGIIGLAIILSAFAISKFVLQSLVDATQTGV
jgi:hypothetical protein